MSIGIDTEAIRESEIKIEYFHRESEKKEGHSSKKETHSPRGEELDRYMASVIAHEIGHNIGMIHDDLGIMADQRMTSLMNIENQTIPGPDGSKKKDVLYLPEISFPDNEITKENVQRLIDRIPDMTSEGKLYWSNRLQSQAFHEKPSKDTGITTL